jgi:DNA-binding winged helix-turn-helix (wHTH) protein
MELPGQVYRFDEVSLDLLNYRLTVDGDVRALEPKLYRVLGFLIENHGRVVAKEEILNEVWEGVAVTDNALTRAVAQLRKAIGDDPKRYGPVTSKPCRPLAIALSASCARIL